MYLYANSVGYSPLTKQNKTTESYLKATLLFGSPRLEPKCTATPAPCCNTGGTWVDLSVVDPRRGERLTTQSGCYMVPLGTAVQALSFRDHATARWPWGCSQQQSWGNGPAVTSAKHLSQSTSAPPIQLGTDKFLVASSSKRILSSASAENAETMGCRS